MCCLKDLDSQPDKKPRIRIRVKEPTRAEPADTTGRGRENGGLDQVAPPRTGLLRPAVLPAASSDDFDSNDDNNHIETSGFQAPTRSAVARLLEHNNQADAVAKVVVLPTLSCCGSKTDYNLNMLMWQTFLI